MTCGSTSSSLSVKCMTSTGAREKDSKIQNNAALSMLDYEIEVLWLPQHLI
jgi:hypothetical protein